jgi:hypothetical protein
MLGRASDLSIFHPAALTYHWNAVKCAHRAGGMAHYSIVQLFVEALRKLGKPFMTLLSKVGDLAASCSNGHVMEAQVVTGVIHEFPE